LRLLLAIEVLIVTWLACGCTVVVLGDNLDPAAPHRAGPGYSVVFTSLTVEGEGAAGLELFGLHGAAGETRRAMLAARGRGGVVAAYLRPGKYELGGLQLETGSGLRSFPFDRRRRDGYAYFEVTPGTCSWIGDYVAEEITGRGCRVSQLTDEQSFASTSAAFRGRFADLAGRCKVRDALIAR